MPGQSNGGFAALVNNIIETKKSNPDSNNESTAHVGPSKGLPSTGLKKNTQEYLEAQRQKQQNGSRPKSLASSRQSSSSSIPSNADGTEDSRTDKQRQHDQEGPAGRGPGRHEPDLRINDEPLHDSPTSERNGDLSSIPAPRGSAGDGAATPVPPEYFRENAKEDIPDRDSKQTASDDVKGKGKGKQQDNGARADGDSEFDPEEHVEGRTSGRNRKMTDEAGRLPEGLAGVKSEAPPGPQNQIVLDARLPQIHVSLPLVFSNRGC